MHGEGRAWYEDALSRLGDDAPAWTTESEGAVMEPYAYLDGNPGKEVRTHLIDAFNMWLQLPPDALAFVTRVVRQLHTASLMMDDVEDNSDLRRGAPAAHTVYGVPQTINTANYVYFHVFSEIMHMAASAGERTHISALVSDELVRLHRGQGMDLLWRDSLQCPTQEEYVGMVTNKTGGLFRIAIKLMCALSPVAQAAATDMVPLVNLMGLLFQIRDDYLNLQSAALADNKGFCEDLTEGKFSFPIIHAIHCGCARGDRQLLHILRQRTTNVDTKMYAVHYMEHTGSFAYTREVLRHLDAQARAEVGRIASALGANTPLLGILDVLRVGEEGEKGEGERES
ncbi:hypothetical protein MSPP1_003702 [Malassezia sp. CBS 17886]|nr:hypothetical protein MSPP1_003702 [Malassezia sp. CBS 17886]